MLWYTTDTGPSARGPDRLSTVCRIMGKELNPLICECVCPDTPCFGLRTLNEDTCRCECGTDVQCPTEHVLNMECCECQCPAIESCPPMDPPVCPEGEEFDMAICACADSE